MEANFKTFGRGVSLLHQIELRNRKYFVSMRWEFKSEKFLQS